MEWCDLFLVEVSAASEMRRRGAYEAHDNE